MLATRLLEAGFDTAYAYKPLHHPLGHAFTNAILYLDYARHGFPYPIVPFAINCYGRKVVSQRGGVPKFDAAVEMPTWIRRRRRRGGCSTSVRRRRGFWRSRRIAWRCWRRPAGRTPSSPRKNHFLYPDTPADRQMYEHLRAGNYEAWRSYTARAVEDSGQQEILNWMCLAGALSALERKPKETGFVDTWIFNSSKVFLVAPPG